MIDCSDATVIATNHPLIVWLKISLATILLQYHSCRDSFIIIHCLIPLISDQMIDKFSKKILHPPSKHRQNVQGAEVGSRSGAPVVAPLLLLLPAPMHAAGSL